LLKNIYLEGLGTLAWSQNFNNEANLVGPLKLLKKPRLAS